MRSLFSRKADRYFARFGIGFAAAMLLGLAFGSPAQDHPITDLTGEWIFVEDRTPARAPEQLGAPMSGRFSLRAEEGAVILVSGHGSGLRDIRVALDGSVTELKDATTIYRYTGSWKDATFRYQTEYITVAEGTTRNIYRREFTLTPEGLLVRVMIRDGDLVGSVALYKHPEDIAMPTPAPAKIGDLAWLAGNWAGTRGSTGQIAFEERWSPPKGGAMLAVSRTVSQERMSAFEFLRIVEREGGLVYIAQPGGIAPTEFVLSELSATRAVFDNPRHDYPTRIVYHLAEGGVLNVTIGQIVGGTPRQFVFRRAEDKGSPELNHP